MNPCQWNANRIFTDEKYFENSTNWRFRFDYNVLNIPGTYPLMVSPNSFLQTEVGWWWIGTQRNTGNSQHRTRTPVAWLCIPSHPLNWMHGQQGSLLWYLEQQLWCALDISQVLPKDSPDSKVHEAYIGPTWGRQDPGGPYVGPMSLAIRLLIAGVFRSLKFGQRHVFLFVVLRVIPGYFRPPSL